LFLIAFCYLKEHARQRKTVPLAQEVVVTEGHSSPVDQPDSGFSNQAQRNKGPRFVNELSKADDECDGSTDKSQKTLIITMFQQSGLYIWLILMMGVFYGLPAIQLVFKYQEALSITGNNDLCYYNFLCSIPIKDVQDFNHILSNVGYVAFGMTFLCIVWYRKHLNHKKVKKEINGHIVPTGIPQHFGIYYAMGFALISEGYLSACYHVCPTSENFQFDTTFMYVIAVLCFIKIYQLRHSDATSNAYKAFVGIAMVMSLEVLGIFQNNVFFWIFSLIIYFLVMLVLSSVLYQAGKWRMNHITIVLLVKALAGKARSCNFFPGEISKSRAIFIIVLDMFNVGFILLGAIKQPGVSSYLLMIFIGNLMVYFFYYGIMKLVKKETIPPIAFVISIITIACWIPALYFFQIKNKTTEVTPAQSRNLNKECIWGNLYDHHDIWHFFSATGLFFSFVLLLFLDDGIDHIPRDKIYIF